MEMEAGDLNSEDNYPTKPAPFVFKLQPKQPENWPASLHTVGTRLSCTKVLFNTFDSILQLGCRADAWAILANRVGRQMMGMF